MDIATFRNRIQDTLSLAGISLNGSNPWDIRIKDDRFFQRIIRNGSLGLGESFMDGWWECDRLDEFFCRLMPLQPAHAYTKKLALLCNTLKGFLVNPAKKSNAFVVGQRHYDLGNDFFSKMLDRRMVYSCAYWKDAVNLDQAQESKLELICKKIGLAKGDRILDIGCGWGGFAHYAAERYNARVIGITVSKEQASFAQNICAGLPVEIRTQDYRDIQESFDHIVSIGMFEHVHYKNYAEYMNLVHKALRDDGLFLLQTIGDSYSKMCLDPWFCKYIFPNSMIPSMKQICEAAENLFVIEDWHNFGHYYDPTLMSWCNNFHKNWDTLRDCYDDRFYRMWTYYLMSCAGTFRARSLQLWQIVFSKKGIHGGYPPVR